MEETNCVASAILVLGNQCGNAGSKFKLAVENRSRSETTKTKEIEVQLS